MSWFDTFTGTVKTMILMENKLSDLNKNIDLLTQGYVSLSERVARVEGKLEAYERMASAAAGKGRKSLPKSDE